MARKLITIVFMWAVAGTGWSQDLIQLTHGDTLIVKLFPTTLYDDGKVIRVGLRDSLRYKINLLDTLGVSYNFVEGRYKSQFSEKEDGLVVIPIIINIEGEDPIAPSNQHMVRGKPLPPGIYDITLQAAINDTSSLSIASGAMEISLLEKEPIIDIDPADPPPPPPSGNNNRTIISITINYFN